MAQPGPQIAELVHRSLVHTIYDVRWVPGTAKFVALGCRPRGTGILQLFELDGLELAPVGQTEQQHSFKCGSFGASAAAEHHLALGNFAGQLQVIDVERMDAGPVFRVQAHDGIVNAIDAFGGQATGCGAPEVVTAGKDGGVRVWDPRQPEAPVAAFLPAAAEAAGSGSTSSSTSSSSECWCVAVGNSYNAEERCILAGYANGDIKMFDLRTSSVRWETNVGKGVCGVQFDRRDIQMNKFVATCLESQLCTFDARTLHPTRGFAARVEQVAQDATLWSVHHLPQNRDVFMLASGAGSLSLHKYRYPGQRALKDPKTGEMAGVVGTTELICNRDISCQPVAAFDWSADKAGVFVAAAFDQTVRVGVVSQVATL